MTGFVLSDIKIMIVKRNDQSFDQSLDHALYHALDHAQIIPGISKSDTKP